jgi:glutaminase
MAHKIVHLNPRIPVLQTHGQRLEHGPEERLFRSLDTENKGYLLKHQFIEELSRVGIGEHDCCLESLFDKLNDLTDNSKIDFEKFAKLTRNNLSLVEKALTGALIIPDFHSFCLCIDKIYKKVSANKKGRVANYIPQLARMNPDLFSVSVCTIDGQFYSVGDTNTSFSVQSICKPINYCLIQMEHGEEMVHQYIGKEPSGHRFNILRLNKNNLPHNPFINAGGIMACSLLRRDLDPADRFDYVVRVLKDLAGGLQPDFDNAVYLSERHTADRNFAIAHFMKEKNVFPEHTNLTDVLEFYFQCCAIKMTSKHIAIIAATLANSGVCPLTQKKIFEPSIVKNCLSLMHSCGLYDFSGEFAFTVGLPAKSGVSGAIMLVVPNVLGVCIFSPPLDEFGNSVRGIAFCKELIKEYNFHNYDSLVHATSKIDPRYQSNRLKVSSTMTLIWAASQGDLMEIRRLVALGVNLNSADYDGRTALHLAASEGQILIVNYLLQKNIEINPVDRWGGTPLTDAYRGKHKKVIDLLLQHGAKKMIDGKLTDPTTHPSKKPDLFDGYQPIEQANDEYFSKLKLSNPNLKRIIEVISETPVATFKNWNKQAQRSLKERGVTFNVYSAQKEGEKIFPFDLIPRVVTAKEWNKVERGLLQRVQALNEFLKDIYSSQRIIKDKRIPEALVASCTEYFPIMREVIPPGGVYITIAGCDLIRNKDGELYVLEDNLRVPSGVSYLLENRKITKELLADWMKGSTIREVGHYPQKLKETFASLIRSNPENPLIIVLTPGSYNAAYFEHKYLADCMGCPLVENSELFVENNKVYWNSPTGKKQVDMIYKRTDDQYLDPTIFKADSLLGIPGIIDAYCAGQVVLANALGNGVADDKAIYHYVPEMIRYYLNEAAILPQVSTYIAANKNDLAYILDHLSDLVIKVVNQSGGYGMLIGAQASKSQLLEIRKKITQSPRSYIAQSLIELSTIPTLCDGHLHPRRVDLRTYIVTGLDCSWILPGALTRVALKEGSYIVNSCQGGGSKDTWVME